MKYLVDANVLSELTKPEPEPRVVQWLRKHESELAVNSIILGELQFGILILPAGRKRSGLLKWFDEGARHFLAFDFDSQTADTWARLLAKLRQQGRQMPIKDSLIAATAKQHKLAVATRNVADFQYAGVKVINPFE